MNTDRSGGLQKGLPMVEARDPEALEAERKQLREIGSRPHFWQRWPRG